MQVGFILFIIFQPPLFDIPKAQRVALKLRQRNELQLGSMINDHNASPTFGHQAKAKSWKYPNGVVFPDRRETSTLYDSERSRGFQVSRFEAMHALSLAAATNGTCN